MTLIKFKEFLRSGAFLQLSPDTFNLVLGPFEATKISLDQKFPSETMIFQPHFWDFLETDLQTSFLVGKESVLIARDELILLLQQTSSENTQLEWLKPTEEIFKNQFLWSQKQFAEGHLQKTVPVISQKATGVFSIENLVHSLKKIISEKNFGWSYGFWQNQQGYLGHSPEQVFRWSADEPLAKTTALAGTLPQSTGAAQVLLEDPKNQDEHQIVVEDIWIQLKKLEFIQQLTKKKTEAVELKHLVHLKTEFEMQIQNSQQAFRVVKALHPTAALGIFPRSREKYQEFQKLQQNLNRQNFAAPFAIFNSTSVFCIAAIRGFFFSNLAIEIFSGCGVTAQSVYENELTELINKRESVKKMMGFTP